MHLFSAASLYPSMLSPQHKLSPTLGAFSHVEALLLDEAALSLTP